MENSVVFKNKYLKYKEKYLNLKMLIKFNNSNMIGGFSSIQNEYAMKIARKYNVQIEGTKKIRFSTLYELYLSKPEETGEKEEIGILLVYILYKRQNSCQLAIGNTRKSSIYYVNDKGGKHVGVAWKYNSMYDDASKLALFCANDEMESSDRRWNNPEYFSFTDQKMFSKYERPLQVREQSFHHEPFLNSDKSGICALIAIAITSYINKSIKQGGTPMPETIIRRLQEMTTGELLLSVKDEIGIY
jgi:hypothetical protein